MASTGTTQPLSPMFALTILDKIDAAEMLGIEVALDSTLTQDFSYDQIILELKGENNERLVQLVTGEGILAPGINKTTLYCDHAETGDYTTQALTMTVGELVFKADFEGGSAKPKTFRISAPESSLSASLSLASSDDIDTATRFRVEICTRKHTIVEGEASLVISTEGVTFPTMESIEMTKSDVDKTSTSTTMITMAVVVVVVDTVHMTPTTNESMELVCPLPACDSGELCEWFVPFEHTRLTHKVKHADQYEQVKLLITYTTRDDKSFSFSLLETMDFSVPLSMRPIVYSLEKHNGGARRAYARMIATSTLVKVDIICDGAVPVRMLSCTPSLSEGVRLLNEPPTSAYQSILFAQSRSALTYRLEQDASDASAQMTLQVRYRLLSDEAAVHVNVLLEEALEAAGLAQYKWLVIEHTRSLLENAVVDLNAIGLIDAISTEHLNAASYAPLFVHESEPLQRRLTDCLTEFFKEHPHIPIKQDILDEAASMNRSLTCNITLPTRQLITTAELIPACRELVIEESCSCRIVIMQTGLAPSADGTPMTSELSFDLDGGREQWIIAGQKRARFTMEPGQTREFTVTLVPMKTGLLPVPALRLRYLAAPCPAPIAHVKHMADILVKPKQHGASFFLDKL
ncbi:hypothetical protein SYNPS1DRAFT_28164 [Syncephalis pseudoplumigaleata]|uniref:TRAPPC10/Trs130 C-terminal domain-containing protein n=1 Tax=Syncephalis pseudoplumigaleata TaxID=1712513 RepID=A0A4P9Z0Z3_9FUNG|nr:hypothetical protein SYNPS1DRAFT_28164 [Syncephalis pseudoplumigaleata]|eukprot:RKP26127.1 hypothetical protein SYNPS1DRAFT_28164 [Syncephalis pseudoplumigaleata]